MHGKVIFFPVFILCRITCGVQKKNKLDKDRVESLCACLAQVFGRNTNFP